MMLSTRVWLWHEGDFKDEEYENMISVDIDIGLKFARKAFDIQDTVQFKVKVEIILVKKKNWIFLGVESIMFGTAHARIASQRLSSLSSKSQFLLWKSNQSFCWW